MRQRGIVLILLSGIVALLLFLSLLFVWMGRHLASSASATVRSAEGTLCAAAGMDYAAARLSRGGYPLFSGDPADRGDDWTFREGTEAPLGKALNPSFSHGEAWRDVASGLARAGAYDAGIDDVTGSPDRDGDERFSAWSGRIRGGDGAFRLPFCLKIQGRGGKIPLNAGSLLAPDVNALDAFGVRAYHNGLAHVLDNLGAILFPDDGTRPWRKDVTTLSPAKILWSRLGQDLIGSRPEGGWKSWRQAEAFLLPLGYAKGDLDRIGAYVDLGPHLGMDEPCRCLDPTMSPAVYAPIDFASVPREVLQSLWLYLTAPVHRDLRASNVAAWSNFLTRMGPGNIRFNQTGIFTGSWPHNIYRTLILFEDEAAALADEAIAFRAGGTWSWKGLQERLVSRASAIFSRDHADLAAPASGTADALAASVWARAKADLAFHAVTGDLPPYTPFPGAMATGPFPLDHHTGGSYPFSAVRFFHLCRANIRDAYVTPAKDAYRWGLLEFNAAPGSAKRVASLTPQGLTMAPPADFDVESRFPGAGRAGSRTLKGRYRARETLHFTSQEDFELLLDGSPYLDSRGIAPLATAPVPSARRPALADLDALPPRSYPRVASLPFWNARSGLGPAPSFPTTTWPPFRRSHGALSLAGREGGVREATRYWPFDEDFDGDHATDFQCEPGLDPALAYVPDRAIPLSTLPAGGTSPFRSHPDLNAVVVRFQGPNAFPGMSGPAVSAFSMEAWMTPLEVSGCGLSIFPFPIAGREITVGMQRTDDLPNPASIPGWTSDHKWTLVTYKARWAIPGEANAMGGWNFTQNHLLPDRDPSTGKIQTGAFHVVATVEIGPAGSHQIRLFVNAVEVPGSPAQFTGSETPAPWILQSLSPVDLKMHGVDDVRLYDRALSQAEVQERYDLGRYAVPRGGPSTAAALLADPPANPVYRSPLYRLGGGSSLTHGQWRGMTNAPLDGTVRIRTLVAGYSAAGTLLGAVPMESPDAVTDLSTLGPVATVQYLVEFYAPGGAPAALNDTPLFESIWLSAQRRGFYHVWDGWSWMER